MLLLLQKKNLATKMESSMSVPRLASSALKQTDVPLGKIPKKVRITELSKLFPDAVDICIEYNKRAFEIIRSSSQREGLPTRSKVNLLEISAKTLIEIRNWVKDKDLINVTKKIADKIPELRAFLRETRESSTTEKATRIREWFDQNQGLLNTIHFLELSRLNLNAIPKELLKFTNLQSLDLSYNKIRKIEKLPATLKLLHLGNNRISKIENLTPNLEQLYLHYNNIPKIENLTLNLLVLDLGYNAITIIENLINRLRLLVLIGNSIPIVPQGLSPGLILKR